MPFGRKRAIGKTHFWWPLLKIRDLFKFVLMEVIKGGDTPKTVQEARVHGFERMVDWSKVDLPKYNPYQFELSRNLDGKTRSQLARKAKIPYKRYCDIEAGVVAPTDAEVVQIMKAQTHVIHSFFEQWPETTLDFSGVIAIPVAIDYYKYKVFRDINPPRMKVV